MKLRVTIFRVYRAAHALFIVAVSCAEHDATVVSRVQSVMQPLQIPPFFLLY